MAQFTMKQLLEAGVHFGHQTRRWNPKMAPYIFGSRNGIHIIDLQKTLRMANESYDFMRELAAAGGRVLFVGTKRQATDAVKEESTRAGQYFVNHRWLGGMLTNFQTVQQSVRKMKDLQRKKEEGIFDLITKKEGLKLQNDLEKLERTLGGVQEMTHLPDCLFVVDVQKEDLAVKEAQKLGIPVVAIVDSNCNPTGIDYVVPGNDDAIRAVRLFCSKMADAIVEGAETFQLENAEDGEDVVEAMMNQTAETEATPAEVVAEEKPKAKKVAAKEEAPAEEATEAKA
ncbi:MAG: 30S ribosomal protein S2 [Zetaproteobacteria bacterium]|nr:MAG: 30S ribosomal protein S2 [Zetaproteobacteria bacterium]